METTRKLKRVVIKEELVELTGSYVDAVLLGQLLYWSERVKDFDEFIKQEAEVDNKEPENQLHGWIYKSLVELSEETMLGLTPNGIKNHLKKLCDSGFISIRQNKNKWDRRKEYKVNLICIQKKLYDLGYSLDGYSLILPFAFSAFPFAENANGNANIANRTVKNCKTVTEITTETTTDNNSLSSDKAADEDKIKFDEDSDEITIVNFFIEKLKSINLGIKVPTTLRQKQKWATDIDRLMRLDGKDKGEICKVIAFAAKDNFWCSNILSAASLRRHYDKLVIKMQKGNNYSKPFANTNDSAVSETEKMLAERRKEREAVLGNA